jgi:hypothetical protein
MATIHGIIVSMAQMLNALVPAGVQSVHFWLVLLMSFAITFILLQLIPLFSDHRGSAFIVAAIISYFVAGSAFATIIIAKLFPNVGIALMAILGLLMVISLLSPNSLKGGTSWTPIVVIIALIFVIWATYSSVAPQLQAAGIISSTGEGGVSNQDVAAIIVVLIVIGVIWKLVSPPSKPKSNNFFDALFNYAKGKNW